MVTRLQTLTFLSINSVLILPLNEFFPSRQFQSYMSLESNREQFMFSYYFLQIRFQNIWLFFYDLIAARVEATGKTSSNVPLSFSVKYLLSEMQLYIYV